MLASKRPTHEDTVTGRRVLLDGLAHDADVSDLVRGHADRWMIMVAWPGGGPTGIGSMPRG